MTVTADADRNFDRIAEGIAAAAGAGARLLALPECAVSGYPPLHHSSPADIDTVRIAELNAEVCGLASSNRIWVVLGTILMSSDGLLNSALIISDTGEIVDSYDKLHLMPMDRRFFAPGARVPMFDVDSVPFGALICYDARFPEPFRYLREEGARVIVNISNACGGEIWKRPVLEGTYRTRASENSCFVVAVNAAGPEQMAVSRIVDPLGLDLAAASPDSQEMLIAEIDPSETNSGYFYDRRTDMFRVLPLFAH